MGSLSVGEGVWGMRFGAKLERGILGEWTGRRGFIFGGGLRRVVAWVIGNGPRRLLLGFRLYWGWRAERRLAGTLEHLRAMHIRYRPEEFPDGDAVPAGENAVDALLAGPVRFDTTGPESVLIQDPLEFQTAAERAAVLELLAKDPKRLERIDEAGRRPQVVVAAEGF